MLDGQPLTTLLMPLKPLQYCFGYLCFGIFFFLKAIKKSFKEDTKDNQTLLVLLFCFDTRRLELPLVLV